MNDINAFCYILVQRQKANQKRKKLLYKLRTRRKALNIKGKYNHIHRLDHRCIEELIAYRSHADKMKNIAVSFYSPLRRKLNIKVIYDGNNMCKAIESDGFRFEYSRIQEMADAYHFDTIVLDQKTVVNPYEELNYEHELG